MMADITGQWLPHLGAALVIASILLALVRQWVSDPRLQRGLFVTVFIASLIPVTEFSLTHYARVLTGDLSITSLIWLSWLAATLPKSPASREQQIMALVVVLAALALYPTALGLTPFDLYAHGYYPYLMGPGLFALFAVSVWFGAVQCAVTLAMAFLCYALGFLESDNLWDYLLDPVITAYAVFVLISNRQQMTVWMGGSRDDTLAS
jgi:hypothetical protein